MAQNLYGSLNPLKARLGIATTAQDTRLLSALSAMTGALNGFLRRQPRSFYPVASSRVFDYPADWDEPLLIDDNLSLSSVQLDTDGDYDFLDETWTTDQYILLPRNIYPKRYLIPNTASQVSFSGYPLALKLNGVWGYGDGERASPYDLITGVTITIADSTTTTATVGSGQGLLLSIGQIILVESEQIYISAISTDTLTIERGANGTTAAAHSSKPVYSITVPHELSEAALMGASFLYQRGNHVGFLSESLGNYSYTVGDGSALLRSNSEITSMIMHLRRVY